MGLEGKSIVLGVSGSIAAYKAVYLARLLVESGADVWPVLTPNAARFVGPLTFSVVCGHRAVTDMWCHAEAGEISHVELAHRASLLLIAPATADLLARLALGRADEPLTALALATRAPWLIAPAMESGMWQNPVTQEHVQELAGRSVAFVAPAEGPLASGRQGIGRMAEPEVIYEEALACLSPHDLAGVQILVTAGPTREAMDPARFVSNPSSGKMGYALARVARRRGARVRLISGPTSLPPPVGVELVHVTSTEELLRACEKHLPDASVLIMAAAPADYRPTSFSPSKLKKGGSRHLALELEVTPDVLATVKPRTAERVVVGFAAETDDLETNARAKLKEKDLDLVVANSIATPGAGFASDTNAVTIIDRQGKSHQVPTQPKEAVAAIILDHVAHLLAERRRT